MIKKLFSDTVFSFWQMADFAKCPWHLYTGLSRMADTATL